MARPRKTTEETWYDCFADWEYADQAAALKVLEALHRQKRRNDRNIETAPESGISDSFEQFKHGSSERR